MTLVALYSKPCLLLNIQGHQASYCSALLMKNDRLLPICFLPLQHPSLRHCLTHLREENTQLVTQNHRLISELEDTSHQLLAANDKVGGWGLGHVMFHEHLP